jgi:type IV secretion system protein VirD4
MIAGIVWLLVSLYSRWRSVPLRLGTRRGARWAWAPELRRLRSGRVRRGEARLGLGFHRRQLLRAEARHALVVFGPPQSGKSAGLAIPALLEWKGPVIASSIKTDLLDATIAARRERGDVFVFDPLELLGKRSAMWSPLRASDTWNGALSTAMRMADAGQMDAQNVKGGDFWAAAAEQRLAPLLFAAARTGRDIRSLVRWAYGQGEGELLGLLRDLAHDAGPDEQEDCEAALDAHLGFASMAGETRGSVEATVQMLLRAYRSPTVQRSARTTEITARRLLAGEHTLYLIGDPQRSKLLRPLFLGLLQELIDDAYEQANHSPGSRLERPLLMCLDELGNTAPLPTLAEIATSAPSHNIQVVSIFHDLAQAKMRYGESAQTVINSHRARMLLPGVADMDTLKYFSGLVG